MSEGVAVRHMAHGADHHHPLHAARTPAWTGRATNFAVFAQHAADLTLLRRGVQLAQVGMADGVVLDRRSERMDGLEVRGVLVQEVRQDEHRDRDVLVSEEVDDGRITPEPRSTIDRYVFRLP